MAKLSIALIFAGIISYVAAQSPTAGPSSSGSGCSQDDSSWVGQQPQCKGKTCATVSPDDCKFIDEAIKACCSTCSTRQNETPSPQNNPNKPNGPKKKKGCFNGADSVQTREYGTISMSELSQKRDALVLTRNDDGQLEYSPVRYWLHSQPQTAMKFFTLRTESGHKLSITSEHLIYETDCRGGDGQAIYARNVQIGRCLYVNDEGKLKESRVVEKGQVKMNGIYSPITTTGSIVVNDVLASCYNYYENESLQKFVYQYVITFQDALQDWLPTSIYQAAFNSQNGAVVAVPRLVLNFLQLSNVFVH
jgi:hypothetical protein